MADSNFKKPSCLPEDSMRIQRVEVYLSDLKNRLKVLRSKHNEVIKTSVEIIKEINDVSSTMLSKVEGNQTENDPKSTPKIKQLIKEFESPRESATSFPSRSQAATNVTGVNIRQILQNFEMLNDSQVLKEGLALFARANETLAKIDNLIDVGGSSTSSEAQSTYATCKGPDAAAGQRQLREKINLFNSGFKIGDMSSRNSTDCVSSCGSSFNMDSFHSPEARAREGAYETASRNTIEVGYEGDNDDSEYDLHAALARNALSNRNQNH